MKVKIKVTHNDILRGERRNPEACPVHRAIVRATKGKKPKLWVGSFNWGDNKADAAFTENISKWINDFDLGKGVMPIEFDLWIPKKLQRYFESKEGEE
jgi:hypothetical protein